MKRSFVKFLLFLGTPITFISALWLKCIITTISRVGGGKLEDKIFMRLGILPVIDHYYQPLINPQKHLSKSLRDNRNLPGIDFNVDEQLDLLSKFKYNEELIKFPLEKSDETNKYYYNNGSYESGDAEYLYNVIRHFKPRRIIEVGSGSSTLMVKNALLENEIENNNYECDHICIEPFEQPWLESVGVKVIREKVETIEASFFQQLETNDILFIDSSHIIRPQGDVLFEYLEIFPALKEGVIIHIHDIFTPKDYLNEWIYEHRLWNEQYLLEAFLTFNEKFKVIGAVNYLVHNHRKELLKKCPILATQPNREPGAFWMRKV